MVAKLKLHCGLCKILMPFEGLRISVYLRLFIFYSSPHSTLFLSLNSLRNKPKGI